MAAKKGPKRGACGTKSREVLVVASKVKAYMHGKQMNTASDAIANLSERVYCMLDDAIQRSRANGRKTVRAQDL